MVAGRNERPADCSLRTAGPDLKTRTGTAMAQGDITEVVVPTFILPRSSSCTFQKRDAPGSRSFQRAAMLTLSP
jgi:hypothetical protein